MKIQPRLTGIFTPSEAALQEAIDIKYRRKPKKNLEEVFFADTQELIKLQRDSGFKLISDGQRLWGDLLRPVYDGMIGVITGSMTRWYETNGFCFPPRVVSKVLTNISKVNDYLFREDGEIKANQVTLPGPYTLLRMSQEVSKKGKDGLLKAYAHQLQEIVAALPATISLVEFTEPSIPFDYKTKTLSEPGRQRLLQQTLRAYQKLRDSTSAKILLQLPQGDFFRFPEILDFPVDGFGIDLTETVGLSTSIDLKGKILSAGIVDAWSSTPEDTECLVKKMDLVIARWQPGDVYITSNSQLYQTISHQGAIQKSQDIAELARRLA